MARGPPAPGTVSSRKTDGGAGKGPGKNVGGTEAEEVPSGPRMYNYLLGGDANYDWDRNLAGTLMRENPGLRHLARVNRDFVLKAVGWCAAPPPGASTSVGQFIDLGCGLPMTPSVHQTARESRAGARVAYVDRDPLVIAHLRNAAIEENWGDRIVLLEADACDPGKVLADEGLTAVIDLDQPVAIVLGGTLSSMDAATAAATVAGYMDALAPGSAAVISCVSYRNTQVGDRMASLFAPAGKWHNHAVLDIRGFFDAAGLRLLRGHVSDLRCWPLTPDRTGESAVIGGVGVKDLA